MDFFTYLSTLSPIWTLVAFLVAGGAFAGFLTYSHYIMSALSFIAAVVIAIYGSLDLIGWIAVNWITLLEYFGVYVALGIGWMVIAFYLSLQKTKAAYHQVRAEALPGFLKTNSVQELTPDMHESFKDFIRKAYGLKAVPDRSLFSKTAAFEQVILWPWMVFQFFLFDAVKHLVNMIASVFGGVFRKVQRYVFRAFPELAD